MENKSEKKKGPGVLDLYATFKLKDFIIFALLSIINVAVPTTFSCMAPFFNDVARSKGLNLSEVGIVFGIFNFGSTCGAIVFGKFISLFGCKKIFLFGLFFSSLATTGFAFTNLIQSKNVYLASTVILRILQAFGQSAVITCCYTLSAKLFPQAISTIMALFETSSAIGFSIGPLLGGFLYEVGGYQLPFIVISITLFCIAVVSIFFITDLPAEEKVVGDQLIGNNIEGGYQKLLSSKDVIMLLIIVGIMGFCFNSIDPILPVILQTEFNLTYTQIGTMFSGLAIGYALCAPFYGYIIDNYHNTNFMYVLGGTLVACCFYLMGVQFVTLFALTPLLYAFILFIFGCAACALYVPAFKSLLDTVKAEGFSDSISTTSAVSGAFSGAFNFGGFIGPIMSSTIADFVGFKWTMTSIAGGVFLYTIIFAFFYVLPKRKYKSREKIGPALEAKINV
uniref:MFS domain-containing protein n=1 Tax=Rhabditophanes sp. KR3021 TaxID=114890 RepID=A0AC35TVV0_9BILA